MRTRKWTRCGPRSREPSPSEERAFFSDDLLVRIHFIIKMIWWTGLAPWELHLLRGAFCDKYRRESETVARCATLGRSQDVCKRCRFPVEGERCVLSSWSPFKRLEVNEEEEKVMRDLSQNVLTHVPAHSQVGLRKLVPRGCRRG